MAGRKSRFAHFVASLPYHDPIDMLGHFGRELEGHAAMVEASIDGVNIELDGNRHYLKNIHGEDDQRQYYVASLTTDKDETVWPEVTFGSFKARLDNVYFKPRDLCWQSFESQKDNVVVDLDRHAEYREKMKEKRQRAQDQAIANEQLKREANQAAGDAADHAWANALPLDMDESHGYLVGKGLAPRHGLRVAPHTLKGRLYSARRHEWMEHATIVQAGDLLAPVFSSDPMQQNALINLQRIDATGSKRFLMGGQKKAGYYPMMPAGWQKAQGIQGLTVVEGMATGMALLETSAFGAEAGNIGIVVAFDAGNLGTVAQAMMQRYPDTPVIIAADNDRGTKDNPGQKAADQLKKDAKLPYILPQDDYADSIDFDDLRLRHGGDTVQHQVSEQWERAVHYWRVQHDPEYVEQITDQGADAERPALDLGDPADIVNEFAWPLQKRTSPGKALATPENLKWMLDQYGIKPRYDKIGKDVTINVPGRDFSVDNAANASLAIIKGLCARNELPATDVDAQVSLLADENRYNPVMDWITSVPYDETTDPISELFNTITLSPNQSPDLALVLLTKWLVGAAALAANEGTVWSKSVLVFAGEQSLGKTSWFRSLVPPSSGIEDCCADGLHLDPSDKDSMATVLGHWLVELGELDATFRKSDIARLKAFITRKSDQIRRPYDRKDSNYPRRTALFASVNEPKFLQDPTGNSRWWTIEVDALDMHHNVNMQQVWAQAWHLYQNGLKHYLTPEEETALNGSNTQFEQIDPLEEMILGAFDCDVQYDGNGAPVYKYQPDADMTATQVLVHAGIEKPTRGQTTIASAFLRKMTGQKSRRTSQGNVYRMPRKAMPIGASYSS